MSETTVISKELEIRFLSERLLDVLDRPTVYSESVRQRIAGDALSFIEEMRRGGTALSQMSFEAASSADIEAASALVEAFIDEPSLAPAQAKALDGMLKASAKAAKAMRDAQKAKATDAKALGLLFRVLRDYARSRTSYNFDLEPSVTFAA